MGRIFFFLTTEVTSKDY